MSTVTVSPSSPSIATSTRADRSPDAGASRFAEALDALLQLARSSGGNDASAADDSADAPPVAASGLSRAGQGVARALRDMADQYQKLTDRLASGTPPADGELAMYGEMLDTTADVLLQDLLPIAGNMSQYGEMSDALATLRDKVGALQHSLAAFSPELAGKLDGLVAQLGGLAPATNGTDATDATATDDDDTVAAMLQALLGLMQPQGQPDAPDADPARALTDILGRYGVSLPDGIAAAASGAGDDTTVPAELLRLGQQLNQLGSALSQAAPDLADKLQALSASLAGSDDGADLFARLTAAAATDGTALRDLVHGLTAPATAPTAVQQAAIADLAQAAATAASGTGDGKGKSAARADATPSSGDPDALLAAGDDAAAADKPATTRPPAPVTATAAIQMQARPDAPARSDTSASTATDTPDAAQIGQVATPAGQAAATASARALPTAYQQAASPINMGQLAFEMVRQVNQGNSRFTIRLDPPELGRIDVRMDVDKAGNVNARLTVDKADTLDLFQRDQRSLERALAQAGLDSGKTSLEFSLRQNPGSGGQGQDQQQPGAWSASSALAPAASDDAAASPPIVLYRGAASAGGVNLFV